METKKEALFWEPARGGAVRCGLCALRCTIREGRSGACRVRVNEGGRLFSLSYGMLSSAAVDPIEKKPLFHFLPGSLSFSIATAGCNLACPWCQNHDLSQAPRRGRAPRQAGAWTPKERVVQLARREGCASISSTYSEPTIFYEYARDVGLLARERGLRNVFVTNGMMTPAVVEDARAFLDAANVDLKGGSRDLYRRLCKGSLDAVLASIEAMRRAGIWVEVTTLVIPGLNDSDGELRRVARSVAAVDRAIPWHVSRFHPDHEWLAAGPTPLGTLARALEIGGEEGLLFVYVGNARVEGAEDTRCPGCGELLVRRRGFASSAAGMAGGSCARCGLAVPGRFDPAGGGR